MFLYQGLLISNSVFLGLLAEISHSTLTVEDAEKQFMAFLKSHGIRKDTASLVSASGTIMAISRNLSSKLFSS